MAIFKHAVLAHSQTVLQYQGKYYAIISAALGFNALKSSELLHEQDLEDDWGKSVTDIPMDEGYIKPKSEVMVVGKIPSPAAKERYTMRLQMQGIDKSLVVFSPRRWIPAPLGRFEIDWDIKSAKQLDLSWQNAYGGDGYALNPQGTGFAKGLIKGRSKLYKGLALPPFEVLSPGVNSPTDEDVPPAGFSPIPMQELRRWQYFGATPDYWQKQGLPTLPDQFNFAFFQQAPTDQQRELPFEAGEPYQLEIGDQVFAGNLPSFNIRLFLADKNFAKNMEGAIEQKVRLDTFYLLPSQKKGIVIARACFEVSDIHMTEWEHTMLVLENPLEPKMPEEYEETFLQHLSEAALLKPSEFGLIPQKNLPPELKQKARADKIFAEMQKWASKVKPSEIAKQEIRVKGSRRAIVEAKELNFMDYDFKNFGVEEKTLIGARFQNCMFKEIDFTEATLQDCSFINCRFTNTLFYEAKLTNCDFSECRFIKTDLRESQINRSRFVESSFNDTLLDQANLNEIHLIDTRFHNLNAPKTYWNKVQMKGGEWKAVNLAHSTLEDLRVQNLKITDSTLQNTTCRNSMMSGKEMAFIRVNLTEAKWEAPNLMQSYWYKATMHNAEIKNAEWSNAKIIRSQFSNTLLNECRFPDTTFLATEIRDSNLKDALFEGAKLRYSNLGHNNVMDRVDWKHAQIVESVIS